LKKGVTVLKSEQYGCEIKEKYMGFTGEHSIEMCFFSLELDLLEGFYLKKKNLDLGKPNQTKRMQLKKIGNYHGSNREKFILMLGFFSIFILRFA